MGIQLPWHHLLKNILHCLEILAKNLLIIEEFISGLLVYSVGLYIQLVSIPLCPGCFKIMVNFKIQALKAPAVFSCVKIDRNLG